MLLAVNAYMKEIISYFHRLRSEEYMEVLIVLIVLSVLALAGLGHE